MHGPVNVNELIMPDPVRHINLNYPAANGLPMPLFMQFNGVVKTMCACDAAFTAINRRLLDVTTSRWAALP